MENKTRGAPNKDVIRAYYENNDITLKEVSEKFGVSYGTVRNWRSKDKNNGDDWIKINDNDNVIENVTVSSNRKQLLNKAKSIVIAGETIKKASEKTGLKESTLQDYSAKEKWLESRKAYNNHIYKELISELGQQHLKDRKNAVTMSRVIGLKIFNEMQNEKLDLEKARLYKEVATVVEKTISVAGKMLGIKDIDKIDFGELDETIDDDDDDEFIIKVIK